MNEERIIKYLVTAVSNIKDRMIYYGVSTDKITIFMTYSLLMVISRFNRKFYLLDMSIDDIRFMGFPVKIQKGYESNSTLKYWISVDYGTFELSEAGGND